MEFKEGRDNSGKQAPDQSNAGAIKHKELQT